MTRASVVASVARHFRDPLNAQQRHVVAQMASGPVSDRVGDPFESGSKRPIALLAKLVDQAREAEGGAAHSGAGH